MTVILHVISGLGVGGAERMLTQTAIGLQQRDLVQHVVSLRGRGQFADELDAAGLGVTVVNIESVVQAFSAFAALRQTVRRVVPDIIQGWMYHGDLAATAIHMLAGGRSRRRLFWNIRASNMDEARYAKLRGLCGLLSRSPDVIIANSEAGAKFHAMHGYEGRRMVVIPNGTDTKKFRPNLVARAEVRKELGLGDRVVAILVARVDAMKDHATFLEAMATLPELFGLLVGSGTETLACPQNVRALGVRQDVERYYAAADLVVLSSLGEGFPNVLAEGMSCGLVPITSDVGDAARIVGSTGQIVPPQEPIALAGAMRGESELSPEQRRTRGLEARGRIAQMFSRERAIDAYARLYQSGAVELTK